MQLYVGNYLTLTLPMALRVNGRYVRSITVLPHSVCRPGAPSIRRQFIIGLRHQFPTFLTTTINTTSYHQHYHNCQYQSQSNVSGLDFDLSHSSQLVRFSAPASRWRLGNAPRRRRSRGPIAMTVIYRVQGYPPFLRSPRLCMCTCMMPSTPNH